LLRSSEKRLKPRETKAAPSEEPIFFVLGDLGRMVGLSLQAESKECRLEEVASQQLLEKNWKLKQRHNRELSAIQVTRNL
jgi:hypothetical protein